jgi:hypothetical protein
MSDKKMMTAEEWLKDKLPFNAINVMEDDEVQNTVSIPHLLEDYHNYALAHHAQQSATPKEVEEAIREYALEHMLDMIASDELIENAARFGYSLNGGKMIRVKDREPMCYQSGNWDGLKSDQLLVVDNKDAYHVCVAYSGILDGSKFLDFYDTSDFEVKNVVAWQSLPTPPQI